MSIFEKTVFNLSESDKNYALKVASSLTDEAIKNKVYCLSLALSAFVSNSSEKFKLERDINTNLYKSEKLLKEFDIVDLYYKNYRFDVRVTFDENFVSLPKLHFKKDIQPDFYIGVLLDKKLSKFRVLGFLHSSKVNKNNQPFDYYFIRTNKFNEINDLKKAMKEYSPRDFVISENVEELSIKYLDDTIESSDKEELINSLLGDKKSRLKFIEINDFELVVINIQKFTEFEDYFKDINVTSGSM